MLIPIPAEAKAKVDVATVSGALLGYFNAIPWANLAAAAAFVYTLLRIVELGMDWWEKRKP